MFTSSKQRYCYHIKSAANERKNIISLKNILASYEEKGETYQRCDNIARLINNRIDEHRLCLQAARLERTATHYKSINA